MKNIVAIIPARGGSKGILRKNIREIAGKPLLEYTAKSAIESKSFSRIILSTEDNEIKELGLKLGLEVPFDRPDSLATDYAPGIEVIKHAIKTLEKREKYRAEIIVVLQPTSPLRTSKHIRDAIKLFENHDVDSLVSVAKVEHNVNPYSVMKLNKDGTVSPFLDYDEKKNLRQLKPKFYARNGAAIYICTYNCLMKKNSIFGDSTLPFFMKKNDSFDLDDETDWMIVEMLLSRRKLV
tara:strand:- start:4664 stop:5374 length:711 start_codon:yes stop_codon:yes gene_type:complete